MDDRQSHPQSGLDRKAMFDLDAAIDRWRGSFAQTMRREDLVELEEHLRSQVDALSGGELSEEEALLIAKHRIGGSDELENEFVKVVWSE